MSRRNRNKVEVLNEAEVDLKEPIDGNETPEEPKKRKFGAKQWAVVGAGVTALVALVAGGIAKAKNDRDAFMAAAMLGESTEDETGDESDEETEEDEDETEGEED